MDILHSYIPDKNGNKSDTMRSTCYNDKLHDLKFYGTDF